MLLFQRKQIHWRTLIQYARQDAAEWKKEDVQDFNHNARSVNGYRGASTRWERPDTGWVKCNVDCTFVDQNTHTTAGWIVRDEHGAYKGAAHARGK